MTKPREKTREELQAEIEDGKKKIRQCAGSKEHDRRGNCHLSPACINGPTSAGISEKRAEGLDVRIALGNHLIHQSSVLK